MLRCCFYEADQSLLNPKEFRFILLCVELLIFIGLLGAVIYAKVRICKVNKFF